MSPPAEPLSSLLLGRGTAGASAPPRRIAFVPAAQDDVPPVPHGVDILRLGPVRLGSACAA